MGFRDLFTRKKAAVVEGDGPLATLLRNYIQSESPRMTQANMADFLGRYADQAWVFTCIKIIQTKAASVPLKVYRNNSADEEQLEEIKDHPLQKLLNTVNPFMNGYDLLEAHHGFMELAGNSYWLKDKITPDGFANELYPLNPSRIAIKTDDKGVVVTYDYSVTPGKVTKKFTPDEILHFKTWNPLSDHYGLAPICSARDSADTIMFSDQYNKAFFKNGAEPGGFLTSEKSIDEADRKRLSAIWKKLHQGVRKAHSVAVLDDGLKFTPSTASHKDMAYGELKRMSREDVLTVFQMPPCMVGVFDEANYSNAREQRRIFWQDCILPRLAKLESVLNERLAKQYGPDIVVKHDISKVEDLAADTDLRARADASNVQAGIMTINEVRKQKNLEPVAWGDTWYVPFGLSPVGSGPTEVPPSADPAKPTPAEPPVPPEKLQLPLKSKDAVDEPIDPMVVRRDNIWVKYKGFTERMERKWQPVMRSLFNDQEREVINKLRDSDWKKTLNQSKLDRHKNLKVHIDLILFDRLHSRTVFRRDSSKLMTETIAAAAAKEIADYDLGISFDLLDHNVTSWVNSKAFKFADEVNLTTEEALRSELTDAIKEGESVAKVEDRIARVFDIARGSRTAAIARTEVGSASNAGAVESYKQADVEEMEWISSRDADVRHPDAKHPDTPDHTIDGETIKVSGGLFSNGLRYPGDPAGEANNVINCRCGTAPVVKSRASAKPGATKVNVNVSVPKSGRILSVKKEIIRDSEGKITGIKEVNVYEEEN